MLAYIDSHQILSDTTLPDNTNVKTRFIAIFPQIILKNIHI